MFDFSTADWWSLATLIVGIIFTINNAILIKQEKFNARFMEIAGMFIGIYICALYFAAIITDLYLIRSGILGRLSVILFMGLCLIESRHKRKK
jgi:Na+/citrate or Na+/malate symporter